MAVGPSRRHRAAKTRGTFSDLRCVCVLQQRDTSYYLVHTHGLRADDFCANEFVKTYFIRIYQTTDTCLYPTVSGFTVTSSPTALLFPPPLTLHRKFGVQSWTSLNIPGPTLKRCRCWKNICLLRWLRELNFNVTDFQSQLSAELGRIK